MHRLTETEGEDGMMSSAVRPYVMDLGSTNGTFLNNERLESQRYYELYEKVETPILHVAAGCLPESYSCPACCSMQAWMWRPLACSCCMQGTWYDSY